MVIRTTMNFTVGSEIHGHNTRYRQHMRPTVRARTNQTHKSVMYIGLTWYKTLPDTTKNENSLPKFKRQLKESMIREMN